jgi:hypothetical protein
VQDGRALYVLEIARSLASEPDIAATRAVDVPATVRLAIDGRLA